MPIAITRAISQSIVNCELTHLERIPIDLKLAREQHWQYENALSSLGCELISLPELPDLPDAVFVEDTAVILDEIAIITNPGANSRKPEIDSIAEVLKRYRKLFQIQEPAMLDGGDVLVVGKKIFVGLSARSNLEAVNQMQSRLAEFGYQVMGVEIKGCLHLKSAVTAVTSETLLINPNWTDKNQFKGFDFIEVDKDEPFAANGLLIGDSVIYPTTFPQTKARLERNGIKLVLVDADELAKAEGAVTCCSLILN
ncbi:MAG TPA: arginine deiminase family protein [Pyrinomonadaceae bacterium]|nr:arginine deiminase family protein [Pyrinomonadaceae bacterium]